MMIKPIFAVAAFLVGSVNAWAGAVPGPYVIWINLSRDPAPVDRKIEEYLGSGDDLCWNRGALMFMRSKPSDITRDLVKKSILNKDKNSIRKLNSILKKPFGEANQGFDGIIVYSDSPQPTYYGLTTGKIRIESVNPLPEHLGKTICVVMPDIVRKP